MAPAHRLRAGGDAELLRRLGLAFRRDAPHIGLMKVFLLTMSLGGILAFVLFGTLTGWDSSAMSIHGWIALALGTTISLAVGGG